MIRCLRFGLGKRGELRNKDVLLAPKFSSSVRMLKFLSSRVLLFKKLVIVMPWFGTNRQDIFELGRNINVIARRTPVFDEAISANANNRLRCSRQFCELPQHDNLNKIIGSPLDDCLRNRGMTGYKSYSDLFRVSMDPRVKPEGDRKESVLESDNFYKVMPRFGTNRPGIFELMKKKIGRSLEFFALQKIGMTWLVIVFSLFLLFPLSTNSATYFLPDVQWNESMTVSSGPMLRPSEVSIDSELCEEIGYIYYSSGQCPAYHNQENCVFSNMYLKCDADGWCRDNGYIITSCSSPKYLYSQCPNGLSLYEICACPSDYKYSCSGTGYSSGSGTVCDSKYTSCNCATNYTWNGSACVCNSEFQYSCIGTGYNSGSGESCGSKYKSCDCSSAYTWSGSSCSYCGSEYKYACTSGSNVTGGNGTSCGERYTACKCASGYTWSNGNCVASCTPYAAETDCLLGTESCSDGCGGTTYCCIYSTTKYISEGCSCKSVGTVYRVYVSEKVVTTYYDGRTKEGSSGFYMSGEYSTSEECSNYLSTTTTFQCRVGAVI